MSKITIYPKNANLMENLDDGKDQDPYVIVTVGGVSLKSSPHYQGGKYPRWDMKALTFNVGSETQAQIHIVDWDGVDHQGQLQDE